MLAEIHARRTLFWFLLAAVATFVLPIVALPLIAVAGRRAGDSPDRGSARVYSELVIEWSTVRESRSLRIQFSDGSTY